MLKLLSTAVLTGHLCLLSAIAFADPVYVGDRYANSEAETFGNIVVTIPIPIEYFGSAQSVGWVSGDPEKDTIAFKPTAIRHEVQPAFGSSAARELQGNAAIVLALDEPALGAKGARELQGLIIALTQPADGARGARELQLPEGFSVAQLSN